MKNIKMIITDLDKTLLRKDKTISEYTRSVINKCHQKGLLIVFATARPQRATRQWQINGSSCYVIANNGATITKGGEIIHEVLISEATKNGIISRFVESKSISGVTVEVGDFLYSNEADFTTWEHFDTDIGWNPVFHDYLTPIPESTCKISVECNEPDVVLHILSDYPELKIYSNSGENWHQIMHKSTSKFNAIAYLSDLLSIPLQDIIAFGDDYNDIEMLEKCGVGVAVENAVEEAKQAADYICDTNDNDGVAKYIERRLLWK